MKGSGKKISALACYDYTSAAICDGAGVDVLLVGDSAGMVMLGYEDTIPVTMDQICLFTEAVSRGRNDALIVADMPFMSYQAGYADAAHNSGRLVKAGADAVKMEGGEPIAGMISGMVDVGIPVMGHIGLQPQTAMLTEGYKVQGRTKESALGLIRDAKALEKAGVCGLVLEMVTREAAKIITDSVSVPTIGIGSGPDCDGQVLVLYDMLGMYEKVKPRFVKRYMNLAESIAEAVSRYREDLDEGRFPDTQNWFGMDDKEYQDLQREIEEEK